MGDPTRSDMRLGYLCNHNCRFCCVSMHRKDNMSTEQALNEIKNSRKFGAEKLVFTGGEPTIRKDILKLVRKGKDLGFKEILIITNGGMCSYPEFMEKLVEAGLTNICFSIPDHRKNIYEHLTQVDGSFDRLMVAIENAKKYDLLVATITTIHKLNYNVLPKVTEFLVVLKNQFKQFFSEFVFINPTDNAWRYREELVPRLTDVKKYVHRSLDLAKTKGLILSIEGIPLCFMEEYIDNVVELHMAKKRMMVEDGQIDEKYNESRRKQGKSKGKGCLECKYDPICEGVWNGYVRMYGSDELRRDKFREKTPTNFVTNNYDISGIELDKKKDFIMHCEKIIESTVDRNINLLDIGCGSGGQFSGTLESLANGKKVNYYGVEPDKYMCSWLKKSRIGLSNFRVINKRIEDTEFKKSFFDIILISFSFHHIENVDDLFVKIDDLLKPGGQLIIIDDYSVTDEIRQEMHEYIDKPTFLELYKNKIDFDEYFKYYLNNKIGFLYRNADPMSIREKLRQKKFNMILDREFYLGEKKKGYIIIMKKPKKE